MDSALAKAHGTATDEAAKHWQTMTGTVRNEPAWRGFLWQLLVRRPFNPFNKGLMLMRCYHGSVGCIC